MVKEFQYFQLGTWNCKLDYNIFHRFVVVEIYLKKNQRELPICSEKPLLKIKRLNKYEKLWKKIEIWNNLHLQKQTNKQKVSFMGKFWYTTLRWDWNTRGWDVFSSSLGYKSGDFDTTARAQISGAPWLLWNQKI